MRSCARGGHERGFGAHRLVGHRIIGWGDGHPKPSHDYSKINARVKRAVLDALPSFTSRFLGGGTAPDIPRVDRVSPWRFHRSSRVERRRAALSEPRPALCRDSAKGTGAGLTSPVQRRPRYSRGARTRGSVPTRRGWHARLLPLGLILRRAGDGREIDLPARGRPRRLGIESLPAARTWKGAGRKRRKSSRGLQRTRSQWKLPDGAVEGATADNRTCPEEGFRTTGREKSGPRLGAATTTALCISASNGGAWGLALPGSPNWSETGVGIGCTS